MRSQFQFQRTIAALVAAATILPTTMAQANVVGIDAQNFNPITSGLDFVTVQSSETLKPGIINLGLFLNYAANTLPYYSTPSQGRQAFNDSLLGLDLNAGVGLTKNWDVGISFPHIVRQSIDDQVSFRGEFAQTGSTEIRLNTKLRVYGDDTGGVALVASTNFNRIVDNPYTGSGGGPTFNIEVAADTTVDKVALGANVGYRIRNPGSQLPNSIVAPLQNSIIGSIAASYHVAEWNTKFIGEIFGSLPAEAENDNVDRQNSSAEVLVGAKHDLTTSLALHAGVGTELIDGLASPDVRVYTGLNYTFGPVFNSITQPDTPAEADEELLLVLPPEGTAAGPVERFRTQAILFEFDSDRMTGNFEPALRALAAHLTTGFQRLVIEGHTDSVGAAAYNEKLSLRRANAIKRYMIEKHNIDGRKIQAVGYGETRPIADNGNYQGRAENRRVEFQIER